MASHFKRQPVDASPGALAAGCLHSPGFGRDVLIKNCLISAGVSKVQCSKFWPRNARICGSNSTTTSFEARRRVRSDSRVRDAATEAGHSGTQAAVRGGLRFKLALRPIVGLHVLLSPPWSSAGCCFAAMTPLASTFPVVFRSRVSPVLRRLLLTPSRMITSSVQVPITGVMIPPARFPSHGLFLPVELHRAWPMLPRSSTSLGHLAASLGIWDHRDWNGVTTLKPQAGAAA